MLMQNQTNSSTENKIYYFSVFKDLFTEDFMILEYGINKDNLTELEKGEILKRIKKQREELED